jgi:TATA-box binding protein (TBP) (component of TFIID and TFIIIB)
MASSVLKTSDIHISAIVQLGQISSNINLLEFAQALSLSDNILYIEYGSDVTKGESKKKPKKANRDHPPKFFYNQITLHIFNTKRINVKIFNNGRIQMTGINDESQGQQTIQLLLDEISKISSDDKLSIFDSKTLEQGPIETVLINSNFDIYREINREALHRAVVSHGYYSSYEPCSYPAVNIKYYYNPEKNNFGICDCEKPCDGKGKNGTCKKITVAAFKSGKIIIVGSTKDNISTTYKFITEFIQENNDTLLIK